MLLLSSRRAWISICLRALTARPRDARLHGHARRGSRQTEILFAAALGVFAIALGYDVGLADLLAINISVSLLTTFLPDPGGIGVAEFGAQGRTRDRGHARGGRADSDEFPSTTRRHA